MKLTFTSKHLFIFSAILISGIVFSVLFFTGVADASPQQGINHQINFQGKVVKSDGTNVADGSYNFLFCVYTTSSPSTACTSGANNDAVWRESKTLVVSGGIFRTALGDTTSLPGSIDFNSDSLYLGINFNSDGQMTPLVRFASVPYAFNAEKVNGLTVTNTSGNPFSSTTTLQIADGQTVTFNNGLTFSGTNGTTFTFPSSDGTVVTNDSTASLTNKTIGSTGLNFSGAATDITTASGEDLTLSPNGAGNIILTSTYQSGIRIGSSSNTPAPLSVSGGIGGNALAILNQTNSGDILAASASGTTKFVIKNDGTASSAAGFTIDGAGNIQSTKNQTLTIGGSSTGDISFKPGNSSSSLYVASNGNVGIGTTIPGASQQSQNPTTAQFEISKSASGTYGPSIRLRNTGGGTNDKATIDFYSQDSNERGRITFNVKNGGVGQFIWGSGVGNLVDKFLIDSGGEVGIGTTSPISQLHVTRPLSYAASGKALAIFDQIENQDIFTASAAGVTKFTLKNDGTASSAAGFTIDGAGNIQSTKNQTLTIGGSGTGEIIIDSNSNILRLSDSTIKLTDSSFTTCGALTTVSNLLTCGSATTGFSSPFREITASGIIVPLNSTEDFLIGGQASSSALFQVKNIAAGAPIASVSASTNGNGLYLDSANSTVQSIRNNTLTIGGATTGDILFKPGNSSASLYLASNGAIGFNGSYGNSNNCLVSNGSAAAPSWGSCVTGTNGFFTLNANSGIIYPVNSTLDLLVGGTSTSSAIFGVLNVAGGTPVASISAGSGTTGGAYINAAGTIAATNMQSLTLGSSTTGNISIAPGGTASIRALSNGNVIIGNQQSDVSLTGVQYFQFNQATTDTTQQVINLWNTLTLNPGADTAQNYFAGINYLDTPGSNSKNFTQNLTAEDAQFTHNGTGIVASAKGLVGAVQNAGSGTISAAFGGRFILANTGSGDVTAGYGVEIASSINGAGTFANNYGLYIEDQSGVGSTSSYNIYSVGRFAKNYFNGLVGIGSAASNPKGGLLVSLDGRNNAVGIFNQASATGDILSASSSGTTKFEIDNSGDIIFAGGQSSANLTLASAATGAQTITFPNATGTVCLSVANCSFDSFWNQTSGALYSGNSTVDLLIGGTTTTSAAFAFTGVNTTTPIASFSAVANAAPQNGNSNGLVLSASSSTIQSLQNNTLTLGGSTTGNINLSPGNGLGTVSIDSQAGATTPAIDIGGSASRVGLRIGNTTGLTAGTAISMPKGYTFTSGHAIDISGSGTAAGVSTGVLINVAPSKTISTAGPAAFADVGFLNLARSLTISGGVSATNIGDLATFSSNCTISSGTCTDASSILSLTQSYGAASGAVLKIVGSGLGEALNINTTSGGKAAVIINATGGQDLFTASSSGTTRFVIKNDGTASISGQLLVMPANGSLGNIGVGTLNPTAQLTLAGYANSIASIGSEAIGTAADRDFSSDTGHWTAAVNPENWAIYGGKLNKSASGSTAVILNSAIFTPVAGATYQLTFDYTTTASSSGSVIPSIGAISSTTVGNAASDSQTITQIIKASNTNPLQIIPDPTWYGTIDNVSVKRVTGADALANLLNSDGTQGLEIRSGGSGLGNSFVGYQSGFANTSGSGNSAFGDTAFLSNTTGTGNDAFGEGSLQHNIGGSFNDAFGLGALTSSINASYNSAFGARALYDNRSGSNNAAFGPGALTASLNGSNNTALGYYALATNLTGSNNFGIGYSADVVSTNLTEAGAIGYNAKVNQNYSIVLGGTGADAVRIGIGTQTPQSYFTVKNNTAATSAIGKALLTLDQYESQDILTASAAGTTKFRILNDGTASSTAGFTIDGVGNIQTTKNQSLTIGGASTGSITIDAASGGASNLTLSTDFNSGVNIGASSNTPAILSISGGIANNAALIVNNNNSGDLIVASASGTTKFAIKNDGTASSAAGFTIDGTGNLQTTKFQTLTLGGSSTGDISFKPGNASTPSIFAKTGGNVGIGSSNPQVLFQVGSGTLVPITAGSTLLIEPNASSASWVLKEGAGNQNEFFMYIDDANGLLGTTTNTPYGLRSNNSTRMWIGTDGRMSFGQEGSLPTWGELYITRDLSTTLGGTGKALVIMDQLEDQDIFTASKAGATKFAVTQGGSVRLATTSSIDSLTASGTISIGGGTNTTTLNLGTAGVTKTVQIGQSGGATGTDTINIGTTSTSGGAAIHIGDGSIGTDVIFFPRTAAPGAEFDVNGDFAAGHATGTGATSGRIWIHANNSNFRFNSASNAVDYSEYMQQSETSEPGDVLVLSSNNQQSVKRSNKTYQQDIVGVVSEYGTGYGAAPCWDEVSCDRTTDPHWANVGMLGQIYTKVSTENGSINPGDPLTSSSITGVAMKATKAGKIIGHSLDYFDGSVSGQDLLNYPTYPVHEDTTPAGHPVSVGKIMSIVEIGWYDPSTPAPDDISDVAVSRVNNGNYGVIGSDGRAWDNVIVANQAAFADVKVGGLDAKEIKAESITTDSISADELSADKINGGIIVADKVIAKEADLTTLNVESASVSGVLVADTIKAKRIEGLLFDPQNYANMINISVNDKIKLTDDKISSISARLDLLENLANIKLLEQISSDQDVLSAPNLMVFGTTTLNEASISEQLTIGNLTINTDSINTVSGDLQIQPLRQGNVSFLAGLVTFDSTGKVKIESDLEIGGVLSAKTAQVDELKVDRSGIKVISDSEIEATASSGLAKINANKSQIKINNPRVSDSSIIFISPFKTKLPIYIKEQGSGEFIVGSDETSTEDARFNFLIVN